MQKNTSQIFYNNKRNRGGDLQIQVEIDEEDEGTYKTNKNLEKQCKSNKTIKIAKFTHKVGNFMEKCAKKSRAV